MFKVGDKVRCIRRVGSLIDGRHYTVLRSWSSMGYGYTQVAEVPNGNNSYEPSRFVKVNTPINKQDWL